MISQNRYVTHSSTTQIGIIYTESAPEDDDERSNSDVSPGGLNMHCINSLATVPGAPIKLHTQWSGTCLTRNLQNFSTIPIGLGDQET